MGEVSAKWLIAAGLLRIAVIIVPFIPICLWVAEHNISVLYEQLVA